MHDFVAYMYKNMQKQRDIYACTTGKPKVPGDGEQRLIRLIAAMLIVKSERIKHPNAVNGCLKVVRAGYFDDLEVKIV